MIEETQPLSGVFANKSVLDLEFIPPKIIHRESQIKKIADTLESIIHRVRPRSLVCLGLMGTGKTATAKFAADKFRTTALRFGRNVSLAYVNCAVARNVRGVYLDALPSLIGHRVPTGHHLGHYSKMLADRANEMDGVVLVLDEIDKLLKADPAGLSDFFYILSRVVPRTCCLLLTNDFTLPAKLDSDMEARTRDTFRWEFLNFPNYDADQLFDILKPRTQIAFHPGVCEDGILKNIVAVGALQGFGARGVIQAILRLGELAEEANETRLRIEWVPKVIDGVIGTILVEPIRLLDPGCKALLKWILGKEGTASDKKAESYFRDEVAPSLAMGRTKRAYVDHRGHLVQTGLVHCFRRKRPVGPGSEGWLEIDPAHRETLELALVEN
jgi:cell division control protein 6